MSYNIKKIVTACPHCANTLSKDYRNSGLDADVMHSTVFLEDLMTEGKLKFRPESFDLTYHDSCYLGRYNNIYVAPRRLLQSAGGNVSEMMNSRAGSLCCGAGGGRILAEERLGERINVKRVEMALETKAPLLISSCPFCLSTLEAGIRNLNVDCQLKAMDITEVLVDRLA